LEISVANKLYVQNHLECNAKTQLNNIL